VTALLLLVVSVGLADSVNPSTLAPALVLVAQPRGGRSVALFTLGVFGVSLAGGLVLLLGPGQLILSALPHPDPHTRAVVEVAGGALLVVLGVATWLGRERLAAHLADSRDNDPHRAGRGALALGAGIMAVELPTALPYFAAIAAILASKFSVVTEIFLVVLYNVAFVAPLLALILVRELAGERASARIERAGTWLRRHVPAIIAVLLALVGVVVAIVGLSHLG
jgi:cytochrome c biogenesis protein CcdA